MGLFSKKGGIIGAAAAGPFGALTGGLLGGAGGNFFKDRAGIDAGNPFVAVHGESEKAMRDYLTRDAQAGSREVMADPVYAKMFGTGGELDKVGQDIQGVRGDIGGMKDYIGDIKGEEADLRGRGYSLQPEDYEAYGQASGNIARMFGQQETSLANALAARGLSSSGSAKSAFAGSMGNKSERLGQLQRQIADNRMKSNLERLGQTRNYINQLMGQQQGLMSAQQGFQSQQRGLLGDYSGALQHKDQFAESKGKMGQDALSGMATQSNYNLKQRMDTQQNSPFKQLMGGLAPALGRAGGAILGGPMGAEAGGATGSAVGGVINRPKPV